MFPDIPLGTAAAAVLACVALFECALFAWDAIRIRREILGSLESGKWISLDDHRQFGFSRFWLGLCVLDIARIDRFNIEFRPRTLARHALPDNWASAHPFGPDTIETYEFRFSGVRDRRGGFGFLVMLLRRTELL